MKKSVIQTHRVAAVSAKAAAGSSGLALSPGWAGSGVGAGEGGGGLSQEIVKLGEFLSHSGEATAEALVGWA